MKKIFYQKLILAGIFYATYIILEIIQFCFIYGHPFSNNPYLDLVFGLFFIVPTFFCDNQKFYFIYYTIIGAIVSVFSIANITFDAVFGDIFSLQNFALVSKGIQVFSLSYLNPISTSLIVLLYGGFVTGICFLTIQNKTKAERARDRALRKMKIKKTKVKGAKKASKTPYNYKSALIGTLVFGVSFLSYSLSFGYLVKQERDAYDAYATDAVTISKRSNFENYGMFSYYLRELQYFSQNIDINVVDDLKEYFSKPVKTDNEFTGLLKGYNVVTIMIETGSTYMVNETLTPNLYNIMQDGVNCNMNYSKNKTNISEMIGIMGSTNTRSFNPTRYNYSLDFAIPKLLGKNYNTSFIHDTGGSGMNDRDIYDRRDMMPQYGFDNSYFHTDIYGEDVPMWEWGNYTLDSETMNRSADLMLQDTSKPFYSFFTSLAMHGPYLDCSNQEQLDEMYREKLNYAKENGLWVTPITEDKNYVNSDGVSNEDCFDIYMEKCMDFDKGLGLMIDAFKEKGVYDNTLFVLYGDHDIYYPVADNIPLDFVLSGYEKGDYTNYDMFPTVLTFSNQKLTQKFKSLHNDSNLVNRFTSPYVIVPTILDLLGVKYNANFYLGDSIFSPQFINEDQIFYSFELCSLFNDEFLTYDGKKIAKIYNEEDEENEAKQTKFLKKAYSLIQKQARLDIIYGNFVFKYNDFKDFNYR